MTTTDVQEPADQSEAPLEPRWILITGKLTLAASAELTRRVAAGEDETAVRVELLLREQKGVPSWR